MAWERLGNVDSYVDPFCGSCAMVMGRPHTPRLETINDADGLVANFFRAIKSDPDAVAFYADHPVIEVDKHAIHAWIVQRKDSLPAKLEGDPDWFDAKIAGWWCWGKASHIGSGWCSGEGPWRVVDGQLLNVGGDDGNGVNRSLPHLAGPGQGVNRALPQIPVRGVNIAPSLAAIQDWFRGLQARFRRVRIACGNWDRIVGPSITTGIGTCGVFLDPPYSGFEQWYRENRGNIAQEVMKWCIENGDNPQMRIALCGYEGQYEMPASWECVSWHARGGYGLQRKDGSKNENNKRERVWFSPHSLKPELMLFQ